MIESAGLLIIQNNKILLAHPTNAPWYGSYTIPKGKIENGESYLEAALRETKEEIGIVIDAIDVNENNYYQINYRHQNNKIYKKLYYFIVYPKHEIIIDKNMLGLREVDWAGFVNKDDSMNRIFWRFEEMINYLD